MLSKVDAEIIENFFICKRTKSVCVCVCYWVLWVVLLLAERFSCPCRIGSTSDSRGQQQIRQKKKQNTKRDVMIEIAHRCRRK